VIEKDLRKTVIQRTASHALHINLHLIRIERCSWLRQARIDKANY